ncbi:hypothetical protein JRO89_XS09G0035000 [Xanthoceras sorbifolium]|uniref:Uncharacterized protein n=1 Tax=Xanthoceras sorbifolium TaxID=99658 RepID=A0ABQ8HKE7_9ROSI|nr:hypothetical protein JRO89_XS09G0035000 [Xanthoceras sorbifolium]
MEKVSFKLAFLVALLVFAGVQLGAEARNVARRCNTTADCNDKTGRCHCDLTLHLCICPAPPQHGRAFEAFIGHQAIP